MPLTKALPKEMLQVGDKPIIEHVIDQFKEAGVSKVFVVTGYRKDAIMNYLGNGEQFGMSIAYLFQEKKDGLAKAIYEANDFIKERCAIVLGDNLLYPKDTLKKLIALHEEKNATSSIVVHKIEDPSRFGVAELDANGKIMELEEKPENPKSDLAIVGMYVFEPEIFKTIEQIEPGKNGEYQITDAMRLQIEQGKDLYALEHEGEWFDIGTKDSYIQANKFVMSTLE